MVERAAVALIAREPVEHINHDGVNLVADDGVPEAIHLRPVQVLSALYLVIRVRLAHLPAELRRVRPVDAFLLWQACGVLLPRRRDPAIDGRAHAALPALLGMLLQEIVRRDPERLRKLADVREADHLITPFGAGNRGLRQSALFC